MAEPQTKPNPLDEVMLAMDVVDTLRHRQNLVERELNVEERDRQLTERLREIYAAQGIDVPDHVLKEGIAALKEDRFKYTPPPQTLSVKLAKFYVSRDRWLKPLVAVLIGAATAFVLYVLLVRGPAQRALAELPGKLDAERQAIVEMSKAPDATQQAEQLEIDAQQALKHGDKSAAEENLEELKSLRSDLEREYELRIVSRPGERSGIERTPDINPGAKNYYIIVEAVDPDGNILKLPVTNEEDGKITTLDAWGLRVEKDVYDQVAADKKDDGIIQNQVFGEKRRGYLKPEYRMPTKGSALTTW